jgi:hypothetical protein
MGAGLPASSVTGYMTALAAGNATALKAIPGINSNILAIGARAYKEANADAYRYVFYSTIAFSGVGVILTFFIPNIDHLLTGEVSATLGKEHEIEAVGHGHSAAAMEEKDAERAEKAEKVST